MAVAPLGRKAAKDLRFGDWTGIMEASLVWMLPVLRTFVSLGGYFVRGTAGGPG